MDALLISEMKQSHAENARLKWMYADIAMQNELVKEALAKSSKAVFLTRDSQQAVPARGVSVALACRAFSISQRFHRCVLMLTN